VRRPIAPPCDIELVIGFLKRKVGLHEPPQPFQLGIFWLTCSPHVPTCERRVSARLRTSRSQNGISSSSAGRGLLAAVGGASGRTRTAAFVTPWYSMSPT